MKPCKMCEGQLKYLCLTSDMPVEGRGTKVTKMMKTSALRNLKELGLVSMEAEV